MPYGRRKINRKWGVICSLYHSHSIAGLTKAILSILRAARCFSLIIKNNQIKKQSHAPFIKNDCSFLLSTQCGFSSAASWAFSQVSAVTQCIWSWCCVRWELVHIRSKHELQNTAKPQPTRFSISFFLKSNLPSAWPPKVYLRINS